MAVEILNVLDELKILDRVIKDKPRTMQINIVQDETLKTAQLKKWKLVWKFLQIKLKYSLDKNIQKNTHENDLTVKEFMKQFMKEDDKFVTHSIDPFLSGIWAGKISELSAKSALHVMMTFLADDRISSFPKAKPRSKRVKRYQRYLKGASAFVMKSGFADLINSLEKTLEHNGVNIMKETTIERVNERENSFDIHYKPEGAKRQKTRGFDFVISALPANHLKHILADSHFKTSKHKEIVDTLSSINYIDMATLNLSYLQHIDISGKCHGHVLTPSGYLQESQGVLGVLAMHKSFRQNGLYQNKKTFDFDIDVRHPFRSRINFFRHVAINGWSSRVDPPFEDAPESDKLRRDKMANFAVMLGGAHFPEACHLPDDELVRRSEEFLEKTYGITQGADYISLKKNFE